MFKIFILFLTLTSLKIFASPTKNKQKPKQMKQSGRVYLGGKHIILMNSNAEDVFASYYFGIFNESSNKQKIKVKLWLPKATAHFEPESGFDKDEIQLSDDGTLYLEKFFKPGMNLMGLKFKVPYHDRKPIEFVTPFNLTELNLATPNDSQIKLNANGFKPGLSEMLSMGNYNGIIKKDIKEGEHFLLIIDGLPRPILHTWYFFIASACLLLLFLAIFLSRTYSFNKTTKA